MQIKANIEPNSHFNSSELERKKSEFVHLTTSLLGDFIGIFRFTGQLRKSVAGNYGGVPVVQLVLGGEQSLYDVLEHVFDVLASFRRDAKNLLNFEVFGAHFEHL